MIKQSSRTKNNSSHALNKKLLEWYTHVKLWAVLSRKAIQLNFRGKTNAVRPTMKNYSNDVHEKNIWAMFSRKLCQVNLLNKKYSSDFRDEKIRAKFSKKNGPNKLSKNITWRMFLREKHLSEKFSSILTILIR